MLDLLTKDFASAAIRSKVRARLRQGVCRDGGDIAAWRLLQDWTIDLVDPLRKTRVRFETPDNRYVAFGDDKDIAGMDKVVKISSKAAPGKK